MQNIVATGKLYNETITVKQISKVAAKKLFSQGNEVYLQSSNMYPFGVWQSLCPIKLDIDRLNSDIKSNQSSISLYSEQVEKFTASNEEWSNNLIADYAAKVTSHQLKVIDSDSQFDTICNEYCYYNCDSERGKYIHFYTKIS